MSNVVPMPATNVAGTSTGANPAQAPVVSFGGVRAVPLAVMEAERTRSEEAQQTQAQPIVSGITGHIRTCFEQARQAKRNTVEQRLYQCIRARRGEYDPDKLGEIKKHGGSEVYANVTSVKCRAAGGWIRDVMLGTGVDRPWSIKPSPVPELPPQINDMIVEKAMGPIREALQQGIAPNQDQVTSMMSMLRDQALAAMREEAMHRSERMADKMEDQLVEGGFLAAFDAFIDDLCTYPTAFMKGPVIRMRPTLKWGADGQPTVESVLGKTWERVSPFNLYPAPGAESLQDGYLLEKHRLSRQDLNDMIGVPGYNAVTIKQVLEDYQRGGLTSWMEDTAQQKAAEGHDTSTAYQNPDGLIDALQFWGSVPGQFLLDWGMTKQQVPDATKEYHVEAWLIGSYVIKAVLNYDPLCRKPYYAASYERVPGSVWGNSVADLIRDPQDVVNAAARSLINNMALASGPQVGILVDRLATGEDITQMTPWRIWQLKSDPMNGTPQRPIEFFQPDSNVSELMAVFEKFSALADEYSGIPRYLSGETSGGAGRTASGLSMLINNAGKSIKQVMANIDMGVLQPLLERLYYHNMRFETDPDLKGDVSIVARGAASLVAKETAQVRRQEFLASTANPIDVQITGMAGRAEVLREVAKGLDMPVDKIVPSGEMIRQKEQAQQALALAAPTEGGSPAGPQGPTPVAPQPTGGGQSLMDDAPVTDNFSPSPQ